MLLSVSFFLIHYHFLSIYLTPFSFSLSDSFFLSLSLFISISVSYTFSSKESIVSFQSVKREKYKKILPSKQQ